MRFGTTRGAAGGLRLVAEGGSERPLPDLGADPLGALLDDVQEASEEHVRRGSAEGRVADLDAELRRVELLAQLVRRHVVLLAERLVHLGHREEVVAVPEAALDVSLQPGPPEPGWISKSRERRPASRASPDLRDAARRCRGGEAIESSSGVGTCPRSTRRSDLVRADWPSTKPTSLSPSSSL